ncbi:MAG: glycosyltransferase family 2 protein [Planctomycetota bacterium]|jgi:glycosyltransferase involved in cell wall biosynthesis
MLVSIVIPTRDRPEILARTLGRIGRLGLDPELVEVIVVDNGSAEMPCVPGKLKNLKIRGFWT